MRQIVCTNCAAANAEDNLFCHTCGASLAGILQPESAGATPEQRPLPPHVEQWLKDLHSNDVHLRMPAAEALGSLGVRDLRIINALRLVATSDNNPFLQKQAAESLLALTRPAAPVPDPHRTDPAATSALSVPYAPSSYSASSYAALRGIAALCTGLGWIILGLAGLGVLNGLATLSDSLVGGFATIAASVVIGGLSFVVLRVMAESISVLLDIEANTRRAAMLLEERLK